MELNKKPPELYSVNVPDNWISGKRLDKYIMEHVEVDCNSLSRGAAQKLLKDGKILVNGRASKSSYKVKSKDLIEIPKSFFSETSTSNAILSTTSNSNINNNNNNNDSNNNNNNDNNKNSEPTGNPTMKHDVPEKKKITLSSTNATTLEAQADTEPIALHVLHEDAGFLVINKSPGVLVHPTPGHPRQTLVTTLLTKYTLSTGESAERPGIVHRLDKDTAGLMMVARDDQTHEILKKMFQDRKEITKRYSAVVVGEIKGDLEKTILIDKPIGRHPKDINKMVISDFGKDAQTEFKVLKTFKKNKKTFSLLDVQIHTGRTHQIRVHLASLATPIVGDPIYSRNAKSFNVPFLMLASTFLQFKHPFRNETLKFEIPLPAHMDSFLKSLE